MDCDSSPSVLFLLFLPSPLWLTPKKGLLHCPQQVIFSWNGWMVLGRIFFMKGDFLKDYKTLLLLIHLLSPEGSPERICSLAQLTDAGIFLYSSQITVHRSQTTNHRSLSQSRNTNNLTQFDTWNIKCKLLGNQLIHRCSMWWQWHWYCR